MRDNRWKLRGETCTLLTDTNQIHRRDKFSGCKSAASDGSLCTVGFGAIFRPVKRRAARASERAGGRACLMRFQVTLLRETTATSSARERTDIESSARAPAPRNAFVSVAWNISRSLCISHYIRETLKTECIPARSLSGAYPAENNNRAHDDDVDM